MGKAGCVDGFMDCAGGCWFGHEPSKTEEGSLGTMRLALSPLASIPNEAVLRQSARDQIRPAWLKRHVLTLPGLMNPAPTTAPSHASQPMNARLFYWAITSALAGFLFGFDTVVISGAEQTIQSLWSLSAGAHGLAMGAALYGTVVGSLVG